MQYLYFGELVRLDTCNWTPTQLLADCMTNRTTDREPITIQIFVIDMIKLVIKPLLLVIKVISTCIIQCPSVGYFLFHRFLKLLADHWLMQYSQALMELSWHTAKLVQVSFKRNTSLLSYNF